MSSLTLIMQNFDKQNTNINIHYTVLSFNK